jgi:hypothetical protein
VKRKFGAISSFAAGLSSNKWDMSRETGSVLPTIWAAQVMNAALVSRPAG